MMKSNEMSMPDSLLRSMEATEYALRAMEMMDEAVWILKTITSRFGDIIPPDEMEDIKGIIGGLKKQIHETNISTNAIFVHLHDAIASYSEHPSYKSVIVPKDIVTYENDQKILVRFPEECVNGGYSVWFSKKFVSLDPAGDNLQIRYYPDWKINLYKYQKNSSGRMVPVDKKEIDTALFAQNIQTATNIYALHEPGISYMEEQSNG